MKKLKKLLVALLAATLMVSALPLSASAAAIENEVMPLWDNANQILTDIAFENGYGYAYAHVVGQLGVTNISIDTYIYCLIDNEWVYMTEMHESKQSNTWGTECEFPVVDGWTYRADYTITITKDNIDEIISLTETQTYS